MRSVDDHPRLKKLRKEVALLRSQFVDMNREKEKIDKQIREDKYTYVQYFNDLKKLFGTGNILQYDPLGMPWYDPKDPHGYSYYYEHNMILSVQPYTSHASCSSDNDAEDYESDNDVEDYEEERRRRHEEDDEESKKKWDEFERYLEDGYWS